MKEPKDKKPPGYHSIPRHDVAKLIPLNAKNILELGCGAGELGRTIKKRQNARYTGIEMNKAAADAASKSLDWSINANIETYKPTSAMKDYDCLVCADILEHTIDPWNTLHRYSQLLTGS